MMSAFLTEDTKATILLCGVLGKTSSEKPLSLTEYASLVRWLIDMEMRPSNLLQKDVTHEASIGSGINKQRLESLLARGVQLGFAIEEWQRSGIWIISRSDADYPIRYKRYLKDKAPPLLFGAGNRSLLQGGGLSIVGSRNVDLTGESFTRQTAETCAYNHMPVISGGARGVDQTAMTAALEAGGITVGILAENLLRKSVERSARHAIADGRLLLISPYHPNARFTVGTAMGRNKLIYALSDYSLVVSAEHKNGGTWAGAEETLKSAHASPVFVRTGDNTPQGNHALLELGAIAWPNLINQNHLRKQLQDLAINTQPKPPKQNPSLFDFQPTQETASVKESAATQALKENPSMAEPQPTHETNTETADNPTSIYQTVLPVILSKLNNPISAEELAALLEVNKTQLNAWLKQAVDENKIIKRSKPVRYQKA